MRQLRQRSPAYLVAAASRVVPPGRGALCCAAGATTARSRRVPNAGWWPWRRNFAEATSARSGCVVGVYDVLLGLSSRWACVQLLEEIVAVTRVRCNSQKAASTGGGKGFYPPGEHGRTFEKLECRCERNVYGRWVTKLTQRRPPPTGLGWRAEHILRRSSLWFGSPLDRLGVWVLPFGTKLYVHSQSRRRR